MAMNMDRIGQKAERPVRPVQEPQVASPSSSPPLRPDADARVPAGMNPMVGVKLWENPCRLSFRTNFIAHHFNQPIYEWIGRRYRLSMPEHVVLYALGLREGITAEDVAASSSKPKNTLSRAVNGLLDRKLIRRIQDPRDRRRMRLHLTGRGRKVLKQTVPEFCRREDQMFGILDPQDRETLNYLMTKIILNQSAWPTRLTQGDET